IVFASRDTGSLADTLCNGRRSGDPILHVTSPTPHAPSSVDRFYVGRDRMFRKVRWKYPTIAAVLSIAVLSSQAFAAGKTITAVMHSDLRIIDPGFTTAYITRDHG